MQVADPEVRAITLGHPSYCWRFGQDRRLALICQHVDLRNKRILDVGAGIGMYTRKFQHFTNAVYGVDVDLDKMTEARDSVPNVGVAASERLPFPDDCFDVTFLHEVIEHVDDDQRTIQEACRVTKPGGQIIIYAPNRLYFFETHGVYLGKKYVFGMIPLVNYLPNVLRNRLVPHARAYHRGGLRALFAGLPTREVVHTQVYPGFDKIAHGNRFLASVLRRVTYFFETTPLRIFGLSHFLVMTKIADEVLPFPKGRDRKRVAASSSR